MVPVHLAPASWAAKGFCAGLSPLIGGHAGCFGTGVGHPCDSKFLFSLVVQLTHVTGSAQQGICTGGLFCLETVLQTGTISVDIV